MSDKVIEIRKLTKDYGAGRGVFNVSIDVKKGEILGYLGPNGAGKSTTIRHLMGFSVPDRGETLINGQNTLKNREEVMQGVSYIPGEVSLPELLTGKQVLEEQKILKNIKDETFLNWLINFFKLDTSPICKSMSLGDKRKMAIVSAFMNDPDVIIMDEPSSGLDPDMQENFIKLLEIEKLRNKTILLSSHIFREVDISCDRITIIKDGKLVSTFESDELKHKSFTEYIVWFKTLNDKKSALSELKETRILEEKDNYVKFLVNEKELNSFFYILGNYDVINLEQKIETLEDYFMSFYKEDRSYSGI